MRRDDIAALASWDASRTASREIAFMPARVLLQDFTGVPAIVDPSRAQERGARVRAVEVVDQLALAGLGTVGVGGYLGGHLTYAEGVGVNMATFEEYPQDWTQVLADAALGEGEMRAVDVEGVEPMAHAQDVTLRLRDDVVTEADQRDLVQSIAPRVEQGLYLVPKVIE